MGNIGIDGKPMDLGSTPCSDKHMFFMVTHPHQHAAQMTQLDSRRHEAGVRDDGTLKDLWKGGALHWRLVMLSHGARRFGVGTNGMPTMEESKLEAG